MGGFPACMSVYYTHAFPKEVRRVNQVLWN